MYVYVCTCYIFMYVNKSMYIFLLINIYFSCSITLGSTTWRFTIYAHLFRTFRLTKSLESMKVQNSFLGLVTRLSLLAGQFPIFFSRSYVFHSRCYLCLAFTLASYYSLPFGKMVNSFSLHSNRTASFASLSAFSLPIVPAWALALEYFIIHPFSLDCLLVF